MSEEVKAPESADAEKAESTESGEAKETVAAPAKAKKINKLSIGDINKKIEDLVSKKESGSRYYSQLLVRKAELEG